MFGFKPTATFPRILISESKLQSPDCHIVSTRIGSFTEILSLSLYASPLVGPRLPWWAKPIDSAALINAFDSAEVKKFGTWMS